MNAFNPNNNETRKRKRIWKLSVLMLNLQRFATISGLVIGGLWALHLYWEQRAPQPQLNVSHSVKSLKLPNGYRLVKLDLVFANQGKTLVDLKDAEIRIQQVLPLREEIRATLHFGKNPLNADRLFKPDRRTAPWPILCRRDYRSEVELEPSERDYITHEFFIPSHISVIRIYTYFVNHHKLREGWLTEIFTYFKNWENEFENQEKEEEIGWQRSSIHGLKSLEVAHDEHSSNAGPFREICRYDK